MNSNNKTSKYIVTCAVIALLSLISVFMLKNYSKSGDIKNVTMISKGIESVLNMDIQTQDKLVYYPGANGYLAKPKAAGNYPGIVMIHENRGLRPEIKATADNLAKDGYTVLAVDLLGGVAEDQTGAKELTSKFVQDTGTKNMQAAVKYLRDNGASKVSSLGWCFGGKQSVLLAISGEKLDATVVYYGGSMATSAEELKPINWPVLGVFGDEDKNPSPDQVKMFRESLNNLAIKNEIYSYPKVGHAFANPSGANYAPEPTIDAWKKTLAFLNSNLK
jgi:carboxymethylenebutenolidase